MIIKTINITLNVLVAVTVCSAAVAFVVFVTLMVMRIMTVGSFTLSHLFSF